MMISDRDISVVLAEDDPVVLMAASLAADAAGLKVVGVGVNGLEAVELIHKYSPDVAVLDIRMPVMDGLQAARRILEEKPTPVVFLTSCETPEVLKEALECGVGAYLMKPPDPVPLRMAVEIAMARHADLVELRRRNLELQKLLETIRTLSGLLPICATCKKIRDDKGYWQEVESYLRRHAEIEFSHGICPDCLKRDYPEYAEDD